MSDNQQINVQNNQQQDQNKNIQKDINLNRFENNYDYNYQQENNIEHSLEETDFQAYLNRLGYKDDNIPEHVITEKLEEYHKTVHNNESIGFKKRFKRKWGYSKKRERSHKVKKDIFVLQNRRREYDANLNNLNFNTDQSAVDVRRKHELAVSLRLSESDTEERSEIAFQNLAATGVNAEYKKHEYERLFSKILEWDMSEFEFKDDADIIAKKNLSSIYDKCLIAKNAMQALSDYRSLRNVNKNLKGEILKELQARVSVLDGIADQFVARVDMISSPCYAYLGKSDTQNWTEADFNRHIAASEDVEFKRYLAAVRDKMIALKKNGAYVKGKKGAALFSNKLKQFKCLNFANNPQVRDGVLAKFLQNVENEEKAMLDAIKKNKGRIPAENNEPLIPQAADNIEINNNNEVHEQQQNEQQQDEQPIIILEHKNDLNRIFKVDINVKNQNKNVNIRNVKNVHLPDRMNIDISYKNALLDVFIERKNATDLKDFDKAVESLVSAEKEREENNKKIEDTIRNMSYQNSAKKVTNSLKQILDEIVSNKRKNNAALKIQTAFRGHSAVKKVKVLKTIDDKSNKFVEDVLGNALDTISKEEESKEKLRGFVTKYSEKTKQDDMNDFGDFLEKYKEAVQDKKAQDNYKHLGEKLSEKQAKGKVKLFLDAAQKYKVKKVLSDFNKRKGDRFGEAIDPIKTNENAIDTNLVDLDEKFNKIKTANENARREKAAAKIIDAYKKYREALDLKKKIITDEKGEKLGEQAILDAMKEIEREDAQEGIKEMALDNAKRVKQKTIEMLLRSAGFFNANMIAKIRLENEIKRVKVEQNVKKMTEDTINDIFGNVIDQIDKETQEELEDNAKSSIANMARKLEKKKIISDAGDFAKAYNDLILKKTQAAQDNFKTLAKGLENKKNAESAKNFATMLKKYKLKEIKEVEEKTKDQLAQENFKRLAELIKSKKAKTDTNEITGGLKKYKEEEAAKKEAERKEQFKKNTERLLLAVSGNVKLGIGGDLLERLKENAKEGKKKEKLNELAQILTNKNKNNSLDAVRLLFNVYNENKAEENRKLIEDAHVKRIQRAYRKHLNLKEKEEAEDFLRDQAYKIDLKDTVEALKKAAGDIENAKKVKAIKIQSAFRRHMASKKVNILREDKAKDDYADNLLDEIFDKVANDYEKQNATDKLTDMFHKKRSNDKQSDKQRVLLELKRFAGAYSERIKQERNASGNYKKLAGGLENIQTAKKVKTFLEAAKKYKVKKDLSDFNARKGERFLEAYLKEPNEGNAYKDINPEELESRFNKIKANKEKEKQRQEAAAKIINAYRKYKETVALKNEALLDIKSKNLVDDALTDAINELKNEKAVEEIKNFALNKVNKTNASEVKGLLDFAKLLNDKKIAKIQLEKEQKRAEVLENIRTMTNDTISSIFSNTLDTLEAEDKFKKYVDKAVKGKTISSIKEFAQAYNDLVMERSAQDNFKKLSGGLREKQVGEVKSLSAMLKDYKIKEAAQKEKERKEKFAQNTANLNEKLLTVLSGNVRINIGGDFLQRLKKNAGEEELRDFVEGNKNRLMLNSLKSVMQACNEKKKADIQAVYEDMLAKRIQRSFRKYRDDKAEKERIEAEQKKAKAQQDIREIADQISQKAGEAKLTKLACLMSDFRFAYNKDKADKKNRAERGIYDLANKAARKNVSETAERIKEVLEEYACREYAASVIGKQTRAYLKRKHDALGRRTMLSEFYKNVASKYDVKGDLKEKNNTPEFGRYGEYENIYRSTDAAEITKRLLDEFGKETTLSDMFEAVKKKEKDRTEQAHKFIDVSEEYEKRFIHGYLRDSK
ncbi:MAG: hypothetical protein K6F00_05195, partial [Lachnospiraceae bacterium]|nr:hypothetical protein [Lachnospiraceae bacterium]